MPPGGGPAERRVRASLPVPVGIDGDGRVAQRPEALLDGLASLGKEKAPDLRVIYLDPGVRAVRAQAERTPDEAAQKLLALLHAREKLDGDGRPVGDARRQAGRGRAVPRAKPGGPRQLA